MSRTRHRPVAPLAALAAVTLGAWALRRSLRPSFSFAGKTVLISGGSRGLGLCLARVLAKEGAKLALCARNESELERAAESGLQQVPQRRSARRPCRRPFHGTLGPGIGLPCESATAPANRFCTYVRSRSFSASLATFGRSAALSAFHCATVARYVRVPPRVAAFRRSSREMVEGDRASLRAISRTP